MKIFQNVVLRLAVGLSACAVAATFPLALAQAPAQKPEMVAAEVKKVDREAGKVTLKHGEFKSLGMPAMTMVFKVKDDKLWEKLVEGAKVNVGLEKALIGYVVVEVEATK